MKFHKEGRASLVVVILFALFVNLFTHSIFPTYPWVHYLGYAVSLFFIIVILQFFRLPNKSIIVDDGKIISPCDGKVVVIEEVQESEFINEKRRQVSIFMSPINVHNNLYPIAGIVKYFKYHSGVIVETTNKAKISPDSRTARIHDGFHDPFQFFKTLGGFLIFHS